MSSDNMIRAPWTDAQVEALNAWQQRGDVHEYTCPYSHDDGSRVLIATRDGWVCPSCGYRQRWAYAMGARQMEQYTEIIGTGRAYHVWLRVEGQQFRVTHEACSHSEAEFIRRMLCIALEKIVENQRRK